jgi:hypothetical protein
MVLTKNFFKLFIEIPADNILYTLHQTACDTLTQIFIQLGA